MKNIKLNLDTNKIKKTIERLNILKENIKRDAIETITEVANIGGEIAYLNSVVDTGETRDSTDILQISDNHLQLIQQGDHVLKNEFGLGIVGAETPHPIAPSNWDYSSKKIPFYEDNPASKYYKVTKIGRPIKQLTDGQIANMQMYKASLKMREEFSKRLKLKVGVSISKV